MSSLKDKAKLAISLFTNTLIKGNSNALGVRPPRAFSLNTKRWKNSGVSDTSMIAIRTCRAQIGLSSRMSKERKN